MSRAGGVTVSVTVIGPKNVSAFLRNTVLVNAVLSVRLSKSALTLRNICH